MPRTAPKTRLNLWDLWQPICEAKVEGAYMLITNWMSRNPVCVSPFDTLEKAGALMAAGGYRHLPVVEKGSLVGIVTERDLRRHSGYLKSTLVDAAMTTCPIAISASDTAESAAKLMIEHKIGALPVIEGGRLVGIVSTTDLLKALLTIVQATKGILAAG